MADLISKKNREDRDKILEVNNLHVSFYTYAGEVKVLRGISLYLKRGETLAIVGESGSGKSVTMQAIMKLIPSPPGVIKSGEILLYGKDISKYREKEMREIRGSKIGMVFQNPMGSLNPTMKVGKQIAESILLHQKKSKKEAMEDALKLLKAVGITYPERRLKEYPHQFSGGMRQRVVIAIAMACNPDILIADEPTTALDVTIQAQILDLMQDLKSKNKTSIILITHDLSVVAENADRVIVMYGGDIMEEALVEEIFLNPKHPYTWGLKNSIPVVKKGYKRPLVSIDGSPSDLLNPPKGCPFAPRCKYAMRICKKRRPNYYKLKENHMVRCWLMDSRAPKISDWRL